MPKGRCAEHSDLIQRAIELIQGFNPATQTGDSYADDVLGGRGAEKTGSDVAFLKNVGKRTAFCARTSVARHAACRLATRFCSRTHCMGYNPHN